MPKVALLGGYKESALPSSTRKRIAVEAGIKDYWFKYVGLDR